jgi:hypothetical protein
MEGFYPEFFQNPSGYVEITFLLPFPWSKSVLVTEQIFTKLVFFDSIS